MRRLGIIYMFVCICIALCFMCCLEKKEYQFSQPLDQIERIELIETYSDGTYTFLKEVDMSRKEEFLNDFYDIFCYRAFGDPLEGIAGHTIQIVYYSGEYERITAGCGAWYRRDKVKFKYQTFDREKFNEFFNYYLNE